DAKKGPLALISFKPKDPDGYGRVVREGGRISQIVEERDATPAQRELTECNAGIYLVEAKFLWRTLALISSKNAQGEFYLTDIVAKAAVQGDVASISAEFDEVAGVNDRAELAERAAVLRMRINAEYMRLGVTLQHPEHRLLV